MSEERQPTPTSDEELVRRSHRGDAAALAQLYVRHAPRLQAYLRRILRRREDAEDVLHDTFVRLFESRGRYHERGRFRSWLYTVATRRALDRVRNETRRAELLAQQPPSAPPPRDPHAHTADRQLLERVDAVLATLPPEYVSAFHLRIREEFRYAEIAAISGESEGTLRSRIHHTLKKIQTALAENSVSAESQTTEGESHVVQPVHGRRPAGLGPGRRR